MKMTTNSETSELMYNNTSKGIRIHQSIVDEMHNADSFEFSVAFITLNGLATMYDSFQNLSDRKICGKILTTDYLGFNDPDALLWILEKTEHEIRICEEKFHIKGFIFHKNDNTVAFIGSHNLTEEALCTNYEWGVKINAKSDEIFCESIQSEFYRMWNKSTPLTKEWVENYRNRRIQPPIVETKLSEIIPNAMQIEALSSLDKLRKDGKNKALLISATGTGKTILSAFDVKNFSPNRFLFLVHNQNILEKSRSSYERILGNSYTYGYFNADKKEKDKTAVFATIQTMSKHIHEFEPDHFDYIVYDETHHSVAESHFDIIQHFKPKFMLGMTATPERMDQKDVFELYDYNIAYEIRLKQALEMNLLCPFHYYGVTDITINGEVIGDKYNYSNLTSDERIKNLIEKIEYYKPYGKRTKGLIFCRTIDEARQISEKMKIYGYKTEALDSKNSNPKERESAIKKLQSDSEPTLDYILVCNLFNEGIDIPEINQIVFLRPTESSTIFIQQLGRGLRRTNDPHKSLIVIDFIGNYKNNYMIPMAISGDRSLNQDNLQKIMMECTLPGSSTIGFEKIAKERIFNKIKRITRLDIMKEEYNNVKIRLKRSPSLCDLLEEKSLDPIVLTSYNSKDNFKAKYGVNLNSFRELINDDEKMNLEDDDSDLLTYISKFIEGKRKHELILMQDLIYNEEINLDSYSEKESFESAVNVLNGNFQESKYLEKHPNWIVLERTNNIVKRSHGFDKLVKNPCTKPILIDAVECGLRINKHRFTDIDEFGFQKYSKYTRKDVCVILNLKKDLSSTIFGYKICGEYCPIFVTYNKNDKSIKYSDVFNDNSTLNWMSRTNCKLNDKEIQKIINKKVKLLLFVQKDESEKSYFYYMGQVKPNSNESKETILDNKSVVVIPLSLINPIPDKLYQYITEV